MVPKAVYVIYPEQRASKIIRILNLNFWIIKPVTNAARTYPTMYPPVGPASTPNPPFINEKTGRPKAPSSRYIIWLKVPNPGPSSAALHSTDRM